MWRCGEGTGDLRGVARNEPEVVDFLMELVREEQDKELRERALFRLGQSKDPRVADFLLALIRGGGTIRR
jgi:hypothetical protein